ncbi:hypothetical protein [Nocardiopsis sp. CC223A]|uniref:hypothetical protein n=1 Tax=Nocardiopsis sp. CC223A TaxID=3044051 RepID=UPI00278C6F46|nr:hypothetical protein [Nocardiopsis sp. CC223A]
MTSSAARSWAESQAGAFSLSPAATDLLEELYTPALPAAAANFEHELTGLSGPPRPVWGTAGRRPVTDLDLLLEGWDEDTLRRVLVWSRATMPPDARVTGSPAARPHPVCSRHWALQDHFARSALGWDGETLPALIRTLTLGWSPPDLPVGACVRVSPALSAASADAVREAAAHLGARLRSTPGGDRERERAHHRLLEILTAMGEPPASLEVLAYRDDRFFERLRAKHPDLLADPGLTGLVVHCLQPFHGHAWEAGLPLRLRAFKDLDGALREFLEAALDLPEVPVPVPVFTDAERSAHLHAKHVPPRAADHLTPHARHLLEGVAAVLPHLDRTPGWAVDLLHRLALRLGAGHGPRDSHAARGLVSVIERMGGQEALAALVDLHAEFRERVSVKYVGASLSRTAERMGLSAAETAERTVPAHGLGPDGTRTERVGDHGVTIAVTEQGAALRYTGPDGRTGPRAPKVLAGEHPGALKDVKDRAARVRKTFRAEQERLDALGDHAPGLGTWVSRYLEHPVTGPIARGLSWAVDPDGRPGTPERDGGHWLLRAEDGGVLLHTATAPPATRVRRAP